MTKDEALDFALEALEETLKTLDDANAIPGGPIADTIWYSPYETLFDYLEVKIAAIKQARALDKKAENARELGLGYEPVTTLFGSLPVYDTPPVQEPVACDGDFPEGFDASFGIPAQALRQANAALCEVTNNRMWDVPALAERMMRFRHHTTPPTAQRQWVGLTDEEKATAIFGADKKCLDYKGYADAIEAKLKELNT
jgi:hypothetical protein